LPKPGFKFVRWENASTSTDATISLVLSKNMILNAVFEPVGDDKAIAIVINEINFTSDDEYNTADWVELYNAANYTIDLSDFVLTDSKASNNFYFPQGSFLYPNSYLVVCEDLDRFSIVHLKIKNVIGNFSFGFSINGDIVQLKDNDNNIIDQVKYESKSPWPVISSEKAATLALIKPDYDNNIYKSWKISDLGGTPGAPNGLYTSNEVLTSVAIEKASCFPTKFSDFTTLRFHSNGSKNYTVNIFDLQGRLRDTESGNFEKEGFYYLDLFANEDQYPGGIYLVKVQTGQYFETLKVIKVKY
jgi:hypothetical protein